MSINELINPKGLALPLNVGIVTCLGVSPQGAVLSPPAVTSISPTTASQNLGSGFSGSIIQIPQATANITLILGAVASCAGQVMKLRFAAAGDATHTVTLQVHSSVTSMKGVYSQGTSTGVNGVINGNYQIAASASIPAGSMITAECDGTTWWIDAKAALASAWTVT